MAPEHSIVPYFAADVSLVLDRLAQINADPKHILNDMLDLDRVGVMGMSLGAIVTAQACATDDRIDACLMMDAPVPATVVASGLRQSALWITRPQDDQRLERAASDGWPEEEIAAQAKTVADALSNSEHGEFAELHGLFHIDFTDPPAVQPVLGWFGQSGATGVVEAHRQINQLTGTSSRNPSADRKSDGLKSTFCAYRWWRTWGSLQNLVVTAAESPRLRRFEI